MVNQLSRCRLPLLGLAGCLLVAPAVLAQDPTEAPAEQPASMATGSGDPSLAGLAGDGAAVTGPLGATDFGTHAVSASSSVTATGHMTCDDTWRTTLSKRVSAGAGVVVARYQQENFPGCRLLLRLRRDGAVVPGPGDGGAPFAAIDTDDTLQTNGFVWVARESGGAHVYDVQCRCATGTGATIDERTLSLLHR